MEAVDSDGDGVTSVDDVVISSAGGTSDGVLTNGTLVASGSVKTEQEGLLSCTPATALGNMLSLAPTSVVSQGTTLPGGIMTMNVPTSLPEQLVVAVHNMNGNASVENEDPKSDLMNSGQAPIHSAVQAAKINGASIGPASLASIANAGQVLTAPPLAGVMGLAGLPQMAALAGIPGLNMMGQLTSPVVQPSATAVGSSGATTPQIATTPQFILAAGQPIQGIQGAQLLIPTSSGVATQQVITIPVSQLAGNQVVQLVASNGQIFTTTLANLQALSQPVPVPGVSAANTAASAPVQPQSMLTTGNFTNVAGHVAALPQIFTNAAGQIVAIGPQMIAAHPVISTNQAGNLLQMPATQIQQQPPPQEDKSPSVAATQTNGQAVNLAPKAQTTVPFNSLPQALTVQPQQTQIAINPVTMVATQLSAQNKPPPPPPTVQTVAQKIQQGPGTVSTLTQTVQQQQISTPLSDNSPSNNATQPSTDTISNTDANVVDGINLEEIKEFAKAFKIRRLSLGLTQTQVGQALSATEGPSYSQSAICRFEKLDITPRSAQKIKPVLERWMKEAEERYKNGAHTLTEFIGSEPTKKRKRRTSFTPAALEILNQFFEKNTHPSGLEMTELAEQLNYDREVVRVWFCNKRQALKNTIKKLKGGAF